MNQPDVMRVAALTMRAQLLPNQGIFFLFFNALVTVCLTRIFPPDKLFMNTVWDLRWSEQLTIIRGELYLAPLSKEWGGGEKKKPLYWRCLCWLPGSFCWYWQLKRSQWLMTLGLNTRTSGTGRRGCWRKYSPLCSPKATSSPPTAPKDLGRSLCVLLLLFVFFSSPPSLPPPRSRSLTRSMLLWQRQKREAAAAAFVKFGGCFVFGPWKSRPPSFLFCFVFWGVAPPYTLINNQTPT